jgi:hypothetical protein
MGSAQSINKVNFEFITDVISNTSNNYILLNTLSQIDQNCLIKSTLNINDEVDIMNKYIKNKEGGAKIVIYGKNCSDDTIFKKYKQLVTLGISIDNIYIYIGGLFEWLLLQDIYGEQEFPTTTHELDILKYK